MVKFFSNFYHILTTTCKNYAEKRKWVFFSEIRDFGIFSVFWTWTNLTGYVVMKLDFFASGTFFASKGPSINYMSMILAIFDPPSPHVSNHEHCDTPSLIITWAFSDSPPPPLEIFPVWKYPIGNFPIWNYPTDNVLTSDIQFEIDPIENYSN